MERAVNTGPKAFRNWVMLLGGMLMAGILNWDWRCWPDALIVLIGCRILVWWQQPPK